MKIKWKSKRNILNFVQDKKHDIVNSIFKWGGNQMKFEICKAKLIRKKYSLKKSNRAFAIARFAGIIILVATMSGCSLENDTSSQKIEVTPKQTKIEQAVTDKNETVSTTAVSETIFITTALETTVPGEEITTSVSTASETSEVTAETAQQHPQIIEMDESAYISLNDDGSTRVTFTEGPCTFTFPASWNDKFIIENNKIYVKDIYNNREDEYDYDGKLFGFLFTPDPDNYQHFRTLGKIGATYCHIIPVTDVRYDALDKSESELYTSMHEDLDAIFDTAENFSELYSPEKEVVALPEPMNGEINSGGVTIDGYTTDYICKGSEREVQWRCEDGWHITAKNLCYSYHTVWYECWDTEDGDYYGWIDASLLAFY